MENHFLLQGIFLTQGSNQGLLHWQVDSLPLSHLGSPKRVVTLFKKFIDPFTQQTTACGQFRNWQQGLDTNQRDKYPEVAKINTVNGAFQLGS